MSKCTKTDRPLISILMAVYDPRMDWLREQLISLNVQSYPNLELHIRDDCSPTVSFEDIRAMAEECITAFPYTIERNEKNLGSNRTFEALTAEARGEYIAYCDQDDIWSPEKLSRYISSLNQAGAMLIYSDMYIIDENGRRTAGSITEVRRHHVFREGKGLAAGLLISNFVTGCAMMIKTEIAKEAIPFCPYMVHDHYLAFFAATRGIIAFLDMPLISYRIHGNNQTIDMAGVKDKASYLCIRIQTLRNRLEWLEEKYRREPEICSEIRSALIWVRAREQNFIGKRGNKVTIWKLRRYSPLTSLFEIIFSQCPAILFMFFVGLKRKNAI